MKRNRDTLDGQPVGAKLTVSASPRDHVPQQAGEVQTGLS